MISRRGKPYDDARQRVSLPSQIGEDPWPRASHHGVSREPGAEISPPRPPPIAFARCGTVSASARHVTRPGTPIYHNAPEAGTPTRRCSNVRWSRLSPTTAYSPRCLWQRDRAEQRPPPIGPRTGASPTALLASSSMVPVPYTWGLPPTPRCPFRTVDQHAAASSNSHAAWGRQAICSKSYAGGPCRSPLPSGVILKEGCEREIPRNCGLGPPHAQMAIFESR
jgi:hypothetical protein